jgi:hypothetical protein
MTNREDWYKNYWAQTWYRNTFLVRHPNQIGRAICNDKEWNNVRESGCHLTCLAMIINIDPGRMAAILSYLPKFFEEDIGIKAKTLGGKLGGLVWDQNRPCRNQAIELRDIWQHGSRKKISIKLILKKISKTNDAQKANKIIGEARRKGRHVICGTDTHSNLVSGKIQDQFFIWDPNPEGDHGDGKWPLREIVAGNVTIETLFKFYQPKKIEFWQYEVTVQ